MKIENLIFDILDKELGQEAPKDCIGGIDRAYYEFDGSRFVVAIDDGLMCIQIISHGRHLTNFSYPMPIEDPDFSTSILLHRRNSC